VTGPKTDDWLVRTVGLLALAIGVTLCVAARRHREQEPESVVLAAASAFAFGAIDLWYGLAGRIAPIYLVDAAGQVAILLGLVVTRRSRATLPER
jgi:hypothetical protein